MLTCRHFSGPDTNRKPFPIWTCEKCRKTISNSHGFIGAKWADIRALHSPNRDHIAWHALHGTCENGDTALTETWWFRSISSVSTWDRIAGLTHRLERDHSWLEFTDWDDFLDRQHTAGQSS